MTPTISKELQEQIEQNALQLKLDYAEDSMSYEATAKAEGIEIGYITGATAYAHYKERFEQAKKALEDEWISINERLPELNTEVLVARPNKRSGKTDVLCAYLHDSGIAGRSYGFMGRDWLYGHYWSFPSVAPLNDCTHWRYMPTSPTEALASWKEEGKGGNNG